MYSDEVMRRVRQSLRSNQQSAANEVIASLSKVEVMDLYLQDFGERISSSEIRKMILDIFDVHLEGISALEKLRISLFSKGQWIAQKPGDLFMVYAGADDIDVKISPTPYFMEATGLERLPDELILKLTALGYIPSEGGYYYIDPQKEGVSLTFKDQTIAAVGEIVMTHYKNL
ncbi:hypothetical protein [Halobacillus sp. A5]|uniref:hypothetical protein n=1 Tax=Halobacillus sp. A5 TaxID=2880263 RepID=UPI0020A6C0D9|nr:hypothetical protein [Halobacillus sp. A5]MCP3029301.1 hypothetical protein [Halobacillus sp. A5]